MPLGRNLATLGKFLRLYQGHYFCRPTSLLIFTHPLLTYSTPKLSYFAAFTSTIHLIVFSVNPKSILQCSALPENPTRIVRHNVSSSRLSRPQSPLYLTLHYLHILPQNCPLLQQTCSSLFLRHNVSSFSPSLSDVRIFLASDDATDEFYSLQYSRT